MGCGVEVADTLGPGGIDGRTSLTVGYRPVEVAEWRAAEREPCQTQAGAGQSAGGWGFVIGQASRRRREAPRRERSRPPARQEHEGGGNVSGCSPAAGGNPLEDLPRPRLVVSEPTRVVRRDVPRRDRVDVDAVRRPFVGERLRQLGHPSLARRIAGNRDPALEREQRGDEDDLSLAPLDHPPPELACQDELGREVHLEHAVPELVRMLDRRAALDRPGVEDEDVHERAVSRHLLGELENGLSLPEVAAVGPETTASCRDLGSDLVCRLQGATDADDICAGICECDGRRLADPTPAAGHEGCLPSRGRLMSCSRRES